MLQRYQRNYSYFILSLATLLIGCDRMDDRVSVIEKGVPPNRAPKIIISGPGYDSTTAAVNTLPSPWVIPGDPDGADDIAAVVLNVSEITLVSLIVRPDDSLQECTRPFYTPMDTINVLPFLKKKSFSISNQSLRKGSDGVYSAAFSYSALTGGGLRSNSMVFGDGIKACRWGYDYLYMIEQFGLYPPAISKPRDVYVTYAQFHLSGISITVYDQSGESASIAFPGFTGIFTNSTEERTLP